jgi:biotin carboxyl carrier protein
MEPGTIHGEVLAVPERVIVAPAPGTFRPADLAAEGSAPDAEVVAEQVIGFVETRGHSTPVRSPFGGRLMGLLAHAGERVREGQPVAWLRSAT